MEKEKGCPTKYKEEYCQAIIDFFNREPFEERIKLITNKRGETIETIERVPSKLPTFEGFAFHIGVHRETLINWQKKYPTFFDAYKKAKDLQKDMLIQNGLLGLYNATFTIFTAKNITDMKDNYGMTDGEGGKLAFSVNVSDKPTK